MSLLHSEHALLNRLLERRNLARCANRQCPVSDHPDEMTIIDGFRYCSLCGDAVQDYKARMTRRTWGQAVRERMRALAQVATVWVGMWFVGRGGQ